MHVTTIKQLTHNLHML